MRPTLGVYLCKFCALRINSRLRWNATIHSHPPLKVWLSSSRGEFSALGFTRIKVSSYKRTGGHFDAREHTAAKNVPLARPAQCARRDVGLRAHRMHPRKSSGRPGTSPPGQAPATTGGTRPRDVLSRPVPACSRGWELGAGATGVPRGRWHPCMVTPPLTPPPEMPQASPRGPFSIKA